MCHKFRRKKVEAFFKTFFLLCLTGPRENEDLDPRGEHKKWRGGGSCVFITSLCSAWRRLKNTQKGTSREGGREGETVSDHSGLFFFCQKGAVKWRVFSSKLGEKKNILERHRQEAEEKVRQTGVQTKVILSSFLFFSSDGENGSSFFLFSPQQEPEFEEEARTRKNEIR